MGSGFLSTDFDKNVDKFSVFQGDGCYFLLAQKVTKDALGAAFGERPAYGGAHRRLAPKPPFTRAGHFGLLVNPGGQNQDLFPSYSQATGPFCHLNLKGRARYRTPPGASLPVWCGGGRRTSCHGFSGLGGVRTTRTILNFAPGRGPCPRGKKDQTVLSLPRRMKLPISQEGVPRNRGAGGRRL